MDSIIKAIIYLIIILIIITINIIAVVGGLYGFYLLVSNETICKCNIQ